MVSAFPCVHIGLKPWSNAAHSDIQKPCALAHTSSGMSHNISQGRRPICDAILAAVLVTFHLSHVIAQAVPAFFTHELMGNEMFH